MNKPTIEEMVEWLEYFKEVCSTDSALGCLECLDSKKCGQICQAIKQALTEKPKVSRELIRAILKDIEKGHVDEAYLCVVLEDMGLEVEEE